MRKLLYAILLSGAVTPLAAADPVHGIGFAAGQISGMGLSYRIMLENYGAQATFGALSTKDDYYEPYREKGVYDPAYWTPTTAIEPQQYQTRQTYANFGLMFFKILHNVRKSTFYAFTGFSMFYQRETYTEQNYQYTLLDDNQYEYGPVGEPQTKRASSSTFYGGFGIGIDVKFTPNIRFALEWPLTFSSGGNFVMYIPQIALHYFL